MRFTSRDRAPSLGSVGMDDSEVGPRSLVGIDTESDLDDAVARSELAGAAASPAVPFGHLTLSPTGERSDIYVVSFFVYDQEDDPRKPTVTIGFNTEADVAAWGGDEESRWNYAFWRHNQLAIICDTNADPAGAELREAWARQEGLWYDLQPDEDAIFNERGKPLTKAFVQLLVGVVQRLHQGDIERIFGRPVPVFIHELEYYDEIATQNLAANPAGVVPDEFVRWCRGE